MKNMQSFALMLLLASVGFGQSFVFDPNTYITYTADTSSEHIPEIGFIYVRAEAVCSNVIDDGQYFVSSGLGPDSLPSGLSSINISYEFGQHISPYSDCSDETCPSRWASSDVDVSEKFGTITNSTTICSYFTYSGSYASAAGDAEPPYDAICESGPGDCKAGAGFSLEFPVRISAGYLIQQAAHVDRTFLPQPNPDFYSEVGESTSGYALTPGYLYGGCGIEAPFDGSLSDSCSASPIYAAVDSQLITYRFNYRGYDEDDGVMSTHSHSGSTGGRAVVILRIHDTNGLFFQYGDVNGDHVVNLSDLGAVLASYGSCVGDSAYNPDADLNGDGCVDLSDLGIVNAHYGHSAP